MSRPWVSAPIKVICAAVMGLAVSVTAIAADISIRTYPPHPLIERTRYGQALNFDLEVTNRGPEALELTAIRLLTRDRGGAVAQRLEINDNGIAPGLQTVPTRVWTPGQALTVHNPFHTLAGDLDIGRFDYEFVFRTSGKQTFTAVHSVTPATYRQQARLRIPLAGRILVWDGPCVCTDSFPID